MNGKIAITIIILLLAVFFYPKNAGSTCGFCPVMGVHKSEYTCIGLKQEYLQPNCEDCGQKIICYGLVMPPKKCFGMPGINTTKDVEMPCEWP